MAIVAAQSATLWQPNQAVVAPASVLVTGVVLAALVFMFARQPEPADRIMPIELRLTSSAAPEQAASKLKSVPELRFKPQVTPKPLHVIQVAKIPLRLIEPILPPIDWQQQIEMTVRSQGQSNPNPAQLLSNKPAPVYPLQQALNAPRKPETMQNGESYRSIYGGSVVKINGQCIEMRAIQVGPSPSNQATIAMFSPLECPGDHKPTMEEELSNWAEKEAQKHQPPY